MTQIIKAFFLLAAVSVMTTSCKKSPEPLVTTVDTTPKEVHLNFKNFAGTSPLVLNTATYTTPQNESITVSTFNYYISNVKLTATDGSTFSEPESYHLLEQEKPASLHFHMEDVPAKTYKSITFMVGVDEARNTSGAQTGALDPVNGMFWTWNTGYIMAKLEGTSPQSAESTKKYLLHIGGFKGDNTGTRTITLNFANDIEVGGTKNGDIVINADAMKWFAPSVVKIAETNTIMMPSALSKSIADNYASMFTLVSATSVVE